MWTAFSIRYLMTACTFSRRASGSMVVRVSSSIASSSGVEKPE